MRRRNRWFITAALVCQLFPGGGALTNRFLLGAQEETPRPSAPGPAEEAKGAIPPLPGGPANTAIIRAKTQEKAGDVYTLRGEVEIDYRNLVFRADEASYNDATGEVTARGHLALDGGRYDEHITASHGEYNLETQTGKLYDVVGTTGFRHKGARVTLTSSAPFAFTGKMVEKTGPERYVIHHGRVTSCELPKPKWTFAASRIVIDVGQTAKIYNSLFDIKSVPVFYFPYTRHPVEKLPRESGFLTPSFGSSSRKGFIVGDAFYWAINRSMDALIGAELWSSRGWAQHGQFRAIPNDRTYLQANYFGVVDRGDPHSRINQTGQDVHFVASSMFPHDVRAVASLEYLSSYIFRQGFSETFAQAINSEVNSVAFLSKNPNDFFYDLQAARYQNFQSTQPGDVITIVHAPTLEAASSDRSFGNSRFFWNYEANAGGLSRSEPGFHTSALVGRFDLQPQASYSLVAGGWTFRPEIALRDTFYTQQLTPAAVIGSPITNAINRRSFDASFELRPPAAARIFVRPRFHYRLKHSFEPRAIYHYTRGIENFPRIIRFDERDIVSDTNDLEVGVVNRLYAKHLAPGCEDGAEPMPALTRQCTETPREVLTWELGQKIFFDRDFGGALVPGRRNVFTATADFSGIAFLTDPRRLSPVISRLRLRPNLRSSLQWDLDYDMKKGRISSSSVFADYHVKDIFFGAGHTYLVTPGEILTSALTTVAAPSKFDQFRLLLGYGNPNQRGVTAASTVGFDVRSNFIQYAASQATYNWDCCGVTVEYRRLALGALRNENQFRFAFTLANVGTFGTLKRQERVY